MSYDPSVYDSGTIPPDLFESIERIQYGIAFPFSPVGGYRYGYPISNYGTYSGLRFGSIFSGYASSTNVSGFGSFDLEIPEGARSGKYPKGYGDPASLHYLNILPPSYFQPPTPWYPVGLWSWDSIGPSLGFQPPPFRYPVLTEGNF